MSFGNKIERELQPQKQINPEQTDDIQKRLVQSSVNKQIEEKSNVHIEEPICKIDTNLESDKNKGLLIINLSDHMFVKCFIVYIINLNYYKSRSYFSTYYKKDNK